ncbi:caspase family protein [Candidatus Chloroploca sp. M-50]|uniref:Caspase family protein n=1 Tax=Candidatus Chloroploca mongolica TaxID=2528176 RepID=A0ABS4DHJ1_9CHLR|nr:caspase family protein [Candidatus Chloroploca mongolica]MBP1468909.1 caspase family protein [Candidatus Chloroploca mongolica]
MPFNQGHALVIGVGSYQHATALNVPQTAEDAALVAGILRDPLLCGYPAAQVTVLCEAEATRERILAELKRLATTVRQEDTLFLFYSGHGMKGKEQEQEKESYYLTTYDTQVVANAVVAGTGVREKELLEHIKAIGARRALLVFNACHAGALAPASLGEPTAEQPAALGEMLPETLTTALLSAGEGRSIITACREQQRSWFSRAESTTLFAQAVAAGLQGEGIEPRHGYIDLFGFYDWLHERVSGAVRRRWGEVQEPELTISKAVGVMALALYRGTAPSGELGPNDRPRTLGGVVREVDLAESERIYQQIVSGQGNVVAGRDVHQQNVSGQGHVVAGGDMTYDAHQDVRIDARNAPGFIYKPTGSVTQHYGDKISVGGISGGSGIAIGRGAKAEVRHVNMGGGEYAEGDIDKREGIFGGEFAGPTVGVLKGGTFQAGSGATPPPTTSGVTLSQALDEVRSAVAQAHEQHLTILAEDLDAIASSLETALNAEKVGDTKRRGEKLGRARNDLQALAQQQPGLSELAALVAGVT